MNILKKFRSDLSYEDKSKIYDDIYTSFIDMSDAGALICFSKNIHDNADIYDAETDRDTILSLNWGDLNFDIRNNIYNDSLKNVQFSLDFAIHNISKMEQRFREINTDVILIKEISEVWVFIGEEVFNLSIDSTFENNISRANKGYAKKFMGGENYNDLTDKDVLRNYIISYKIVRKNTISRFI